MHTAPVRPIVMKESISVNTPRKKNYGVESMNQANLDHDSQVKKNYLVLKLKYNLKKNN